MESNTVIYTIFMPNISDMSITTIQQLTSLAPPGNRTSVKFSDTNIRKNFTLEALPEVFFPSSLISLDVQVFNFDTTIFQLRHYGMAS